MPPLRMPANLPRQTKARPPVREHPREGTNPRSVAEKGVYNTIFALSAQGGPQKTLSVAAMNPCNISPRPRRDRQMTERMTRDKADLPFQYCRPPIQYSRPPVSVQVPSPFPNYTVPLVTPVTPVPQQRRPPRNSPSAYLEQICILGLRSYGIFPTKMGKASCHSPPSSAAPYSSGAPPSPETRNS